MLFRRWQSFCRGISDRRRSVSVLNVYVAELLYMLAEVLCLYEALSVIGLRFCQNLLHIQDNSVFCVIKGDFGRFEACSMTWV